MQLESQSSSRKTSLDPSCIFPNFFKSRVQNIITFLHFQQTNLYLRFSGFSRNIPSLEKIIANIWENGTNSLFHCRKKNKNNTF